MILVKLYFAFAVAHQQVAMDFSKVYHISDRLFVGLPGLLSDSTTLYEALDSFSFILIYLSIYLLLAVSYAHA
jgi:hypothetical protein